MNYPNVRGEYAMPLRTGTVTTEGPPAQRYPAQVKPGDIMVDQGRLAIVERISYSSSTGKVRWTIGVVGGSVFEVPMNHLLQIYPGQREDRIILDVTVYELRAGDRPEGMGMEGEIFTIVPIGGGTSDFQVTFVDGTVEAWNHYAPKLRVSRDRAQTTYNENRNAIRLSDVTNSLIEKTQAMNVQMDEAMKELAGREITAAERRAISDMHLARKEIGPSVPEVASWEDLERIVSSDTQEEDAKLDFLDDGTIFIIPTSAWAKYLMAKDAGEGTLMTAYACMVIDKQGKVRKNRYGGTT